jgi:hypothetical protein
VAEVLVAARDLLGGNAANDPLRYRQGDIVIVFPDGHVWGSLEALPDFWRLTVVSLLDTDRTLAIESTFNPIIPSQMTRRRKRFMDITKLSNPVQNNLNTTGVSNVTRLGFFNALTLRV